MMFCKKCEMIVASLMLVLGVLFLLADLKVGGWNFWGINWWTALFLAIAVASFGHRSCADCQALCGNDSGMKKKR